MKKQLHVSIEKAKLLTLAASHSAEVIRRTGKASTSQKIFKKSLDDDAREVEKFIIIMRMVMRVNKNCISPSCWGMYLGER